MVAGAILVAVGVGLAPHLVKIGVSVSSALALVLLLGGLAAVVGGGRAALRGRHVAAKVAGGLGTAVAVLVVGTAFLAARPELDPGRIGVVGFSVGGEEAIGASAADPRIRAVVAEGATARRAADERWLSDVYGWRGRVQEGVEALQDRVTDALTEASPPTPLREAVATASDVRYLLITAGEVEDEAHAAAHIAAGASDRVEVWTVEGVGHTGAWAADPDEWTDRVVTFLDRALA